MNCQSARHLIFAFADNQLDVRDNCALLDHLKMCPACTARVDEHQRLREAVRRSMDAIPVPAELGARIRESLRQPRQRGRWGARAKLLVASLAAAACFAFAFKSVKEFVSKGKPLTSDGRGNIVERGLNAAFLVAYRHNECCSKSVVHHDPELPRNLAMIGPMMSEHYGNHLTVFSPDFSRFGFHLESAAYCGIQSQEQRRGAHLVYAADSGDVRISFFSVPRWDCLDQCGQREVDATGMRSYNLPQDGGTILNLVYWHQDATTYICCAAMDCDKLAEIVRDVRMASIAAASDFDK